MDLENQLSFIDSVNSMCEEKMSDGHGKGVEVAFRSSSRKMGVRYITPVFQSLTGGIGFF